VAGKTTESSNSHLKHSLKKQRANLIYHLIKKNKSKKKATRKGDLFSYDILAV